ncbi:thermonuclease family protein [Lentzea aerocolonigenes]|uniref:thermonuclease family protein n=1 Tax=Lentzea aerocolonigenes TaxID=68170 RepID=UPI0012E12663|nr:thermonuclease family protein [Lentzea aerocolonigenes]
MSVVTTVATTGAVTFAGDAFPGGRGSSGLEQTVHRGDAVEVTVREVSEVDSFEAVEPATGVFFRARVAGVRRLADCRLAESRAVARNLLLGKGVRLLVRRDGASGSDQIVADVVLPDGRDYARTVVHDGVAEADLATREELAPVETDARRDRRGLWATSCPSVETTTNAPSSSATSTTTTTTTVPATTESSSQPPPSPPVSSSSAPPDGPLIVVRGGRCTTEGERGTTITGNEMVCTRTDKDELRWRRAK